MKFKPGPQAIPSVDPHKFLYDLPTTAHLLSTNIWAVRALIAQGKLKYVKVGHAFLISPEYIREFIEKNAVSNAA
jgi:hypothetical protein